VEKRGKTKQTNKQTKLKDTSGVGEKTGENYDDHDEAKGEEVGGAGADSGPRTRDSGACHWGQRVRQTLLLLIHPHSNTRTRIPGQTQVHNANIKTLQDIATTDNFRAT